MRDVFWDAFFDEVSGHDIEKAAYVGSMLQSLKSLAGDGGYAARISALAGRQKAFEALKAKRLRAVAREGVVAPHDVPEPGAMLHDFYRRPATASQAVRPGAERNWLTVAQRMDNAGPRPTAFGG
jgi:hypothetical protein